MAEANIKFNIGFDIDRKSFNQLKEHLDEIIREADNPKKDLGANLKKQLQEAGVAAKELKGILNQSWDSKLNQFNLTTMNNEFKKAGQSATDFLNAISKGTADGAQAADLLARGIINSNIQLKESNKLLDRMAVTFKNTVRYGISSSVFNTFTNSVQKAYNYTKNLDTSLNDIRIVSGQSADQMATLWEINEGSVSGVIVSGASAYS